MASSSDTSRQQHVRQGMIFPDTKTLRQKATLAFAVGNCGLKHSPKSGGSSKTYLCSGFEGPGKGCQAMIRAQKQKTGEWKCTVENVNVVHVNCSGGDTRGTILAIEHVVASTVVSKRAITCPALKKTIEAHTGRKTSLRTINRARGNILNSIEEEEVKTAYSILPAYMDELEKESPGTMANVERDPETNEMTRLFVMTGRAAHVAANSVFKIVCVDAGHLKGEYEGVVLVMATKDSDNKLVMAAFAIVPKENADGYAYLFREAKKNPEMAEFLDNPKTTIYADGHKGSPAALSKELPLSQFRTCTKHLIGNLKKGIGPVVTQAIFEASKCPAESIFLSIMQWLTAAIRAMAPPLMAIELVEKSAATFAARAKYLQDSPQVHTDFAAKHFENEKKQSQGMNVIPCGNGVYVVKKHLPSGWRENRVTLKFASAGHAASISCTCRYPMRFGILCQHGFAILREEEKMIEAPTFVDEGFLAESYRALYSDVTYGLKPPIPSLLGKDLSLLPPAEVTGKAGRPNKGPRKRARIRSNGEFNSSARFSQSLENLSGTASEAAGRRGGERPVAEFAG